MALPDPPSRTDPANFSSRADVFFDALATESANWDLLAANLDSSVTTVTAGLSAGLWVSGTTYSIGNLRFSPANGLLYRRLTAGAGTTDPSADTTNWALQTVAAPTLVVITTTTHTAALRSHVEMTNTAQCTVTLPPSPAVGDWVWIGFANGRTDNIIARNSTNIHGLAEDVTVDRANAGMILRYVSASFGWRILK